MQFETHEWRHWIAENKYYSIRIAKGGAYSARLDFTVGVGIGIGKNGKPQSGVPKPVFTTFEDARQACIEHEKGGQQP